jgi:NAD(P)H-dependent FMN reductase
VSSQFQLAVIIGSVRAGRFGPVVADWLLTQLKQRDAFRVDVIDLAEVDLPIDLGGGGDTAAYAARIDAAEAFVVVTPEYNRGYPGGLKVAIDTVRDEWRAKPVAFVSYGGTAGGLRSVEQLRQVFGELQAVTIRECVSFHRVHGLFDDEGRLHRAEHPEAAVQSMLDQLASWAAILRHGREAV